ncbi:MAG: AraC family transcriptional regulator [Spirochaetales bacterium]|nr:AraC family transcriptional regulator [Spirochaetales bacterium]
MKYIRREEGFINQELYVIPPVVSTDGAHSVLLRNFMVSDAGYFPEAAGHQKSRRTPVEEGILLYCCEGEGFIRTGEDATVILKKNQACYIPPGIRHIYGSSDNHPWSLYWMHVKGDLLESYTSALDGYRGVISLCSRTVNQLGSLFSYLLETMGEGYSGDILLKSGQLGAAILTSVLYGNRSFHRDISRSNLKRVDRIINRMRESLDEGENLSLEDMASWLNLSVPHFSDTFKKARGCSPVEFYSRMKIQKACRLLEVSDLEVQEIGELCLYRDRYYFSRVFKKIMGLAPTEYRNKVNQS